MKRKIASMIIGMMLIGSASVGSYAAEANLDFIIQKAKENNTEWSLLNKQLERESKDYRVAINTSKAITPGKEDDEGYTYDEKVIMELTPLEADKSYSDLKYQELQKEHELTLKTIEYYYTYINLEDQVEYKKEDYEIVSDQYDAKKIEFDLGQITELSLKEYEKAYMESYLAYLNAKNSFENYKANFNIFMGKEPTADISVAVASIPEKTLEAIDMAEITQSVIEKSYQIDQYEKSIAIQEKTRALKSRFSGFGDVAVELEQIEDNIFNYENKVKTTTLQLKYDVISNYNNVILADYDLQVQEIAFEIAKKEYDVAKLKYENGLLSFLEYQQSKVTYESAYYSYNQAKLSHYMAVSEFENFVSENTTEIVNN